jgi:hypothetical protein
VDFTQPEQNLRGFVKTRGSLEPEEVVFWWSGNIYSFVPGEQSRHLFRFEGYNIARVVEIEGGYQQLTREAAFYQDPQTGEMLEHWANPLNGRTVGVVHVWNDPVNQQLLLDGPRGRFAVPVTEMDDDTLCWHIDIFLNYPSPLSRAQYPRYSQSDVYQGAELFQFYTRRSDLENPALPSVPCQNTWTRLGPWVPWMEMGDAPGNLVYQCRGRKLAHGYGDLPLALRAYVEAHQPQYRTAPTEFTSPNETSWTYFKKLIQQRDRLEREIGQQ